MHLILGTIIYLLPSLWDFLHLTFDSQMIFGGRVYQLVLTDETAEMSFLCRASLGRGSTPPPHIEEPVEAVGAQ